MTTPLPATRLEGLDLAPRSLLIGGEPVDAVAGRRLPTVDPSTGATLTTVALGEAADVDLAVAAARAALGGSWGRTDPDARQRILLRFAELLVEHVEELALIDVADVGRTITAARFLVADGAALLRWYAARTRTLEGRTIPHSRPGDFFVYTTQRPVGVVAAITPWNAPLTIALWKIGAALATGCTVVHKPAEQSPLSALRLAELALEAGVPAGVYNVVTGDGRAGAALAAHHGVDKISFTGSVETGRRVVEASAGNMKRLTMELGGKSPNVVFADADLDLAVPGVAMAIFAGSGQICAAGSRLLVERPIHDELVDRVAEFGRGLRVGDPIDPATQLGPLVSAEQLARVMGYLDSGRSEGASVVTGGGRLTGADHDRGFYVEPTVFTDVRPEMRIVREEIFGPVLVTIPFDTEDEAAAMANDTEFGLAAGVWTRDLSRAHRFADRLEAGTVSVNTYGQLDPAVPMGGWKNSGYGKDLGAQQIDEYLETKAVWVRV